MFTTLDSTNGFLKALPERQATLCYTQQQMAGYGQQQRKWHSDNRDLTFSLLLPVPVSVTHLSGLSPLIALTVLDSLRTHLGIDAYFKWPNDMLLVQHGCLGKLGGILLEVKHVDAAGVWLIIGIGLNADSDEMVFSERNSVPSFAKVGCGLANFEQKRLRQFFVGLIEALICLSANYCQDSFEKQYLSLKKRDYFAVGENVFVYDTGSVQQGLYQGLNSAGELLVRINDTLHKYHSGSVSIRPCNEL
ncbi:biotin--[acetyl-CoA-carboxylase] ligase [Thiosulfatimonas sediminis]|uniref:biotin--[acetyl-CoA-carboxylase] ligase n=1 Tax=Thiosulfatimonas sediminis TaxID=2675054 RepID=UPI001566F07A|nr:biotin--[acetyl-CoA-carboxylase] ligase [Thiosulfatimonas sediminis]